MKRARPRPVSRTERDGIEKKFKKERMLQSLTHDIDSTLCCGSTIYTATSSLRVFYSSSKVKVQRSLHSPDVPFSDPDCMETRMDTHNNIQQPRPLMSRPDL